MSRHVWVSIFFAGALGYGGAQEIGYVETFSLADDRAAALKELVPGTDDFYYYRALHAQNMGDRAAFKDPWTAGCANATASSSTAPENC
jgi:hypothetical protein